MLNQYQSVSCSSKLEEDSLLVSHAKKLRQELAKGRTYDQACKTLVDLDQKTKTRINDDLLKIIISEMHLGKGYAEDDIALFLGIPVQKIQTLLRDMLHLIGRELAGHRQNFSHLTH